MPPTAASTPSIRCSECRRRFEPDREQRALIARARKSGTSLIALGCPHCGLSSFWNPMTASAPRVRARVQFACPGARCDGIVCRVKDDAGKTFWGCGECGRAWPRSTLKRRI